MYKSYGSFFLEMEETLRTLERLSAPIALPSSPSTALSQGTLSLSGLMAATAGSVPLPAPAQEQPQEAGVEQAPQPKFSEYVRMELNRLELMANVLGFVRTLSQIGHLRKHLEQVGPQVDVWRDSALPHEVKFLRRAFRDDLQQQPVFLPERGRAKWFKHAKPFGEKVFDSLPALRHDIADAGTCFATDNATACVFHLMRVVEQVFRLLARKLRVSGLKADLDYEDFKRIYAQLNKKLNNLRNSKRGKRREREIDFYADMADKCQFFKEMWRDKSMHSRKHYGIDEAGSILTRVRELTERAAERLSG